VKEDTQVDWSLSRVEEAQSHIREIYLECLSSLTVELNDYHEIAWSSSQYEKLVGYWLIFFLQVCYDRYLGICQTELAPLDDRKHRYKGAVLGRLAEYAYSDSLNMRLYQEIRSLMSGDRHSTGVLPEWSSCLGGFSTATLATAPVQIVDPYFVYHGSAIERRIKHLGMYWAVRKIASPLIIYRKSTATVIIDKKWRTKDQTSRGVLNDGLFLKLVRKHMPVEFLEGFAALRWCAKSHKSKHLYTANGIPNNLAFKFLAAEQHDSGNLFCHQHGGGYGLHRFNFSEFYERRVSDIFFTWGWTEDEVTRPLPVPARISSVRPTPKSGVLFKYSIFPRYVIHIGEFPMGLRCRRFNEQAIQLLRPLGSVELEIGFPRGESGMTEKNMLAQAGITVNLKSGLEQHYSLHLFNYPGSGWLETLSANLPTICIFDPEMTVFRRQARPWISALVDAGILHATPESAAEKVLQVHADPYQWWDLFEPQEARKGFLSRYGRMEENWSQAWHEEFSRYV
jgi:putative transferase (TIGR04331 family)